MIIAMGSWDGSMPTALGVFENKEKFLEAARSGAIDDAVEHVYLYDVPGINKPVTSENGHFAIVDEHEWKDGAPWNGEKVRDA